MLIWRGYGFVVFLIVFGCSVVANLIVGDAYSTNKFYLVVALAVSAVLVYFADEALSRRAEANKRELVDKATGQTVVWRQSNQLFFIDMKWWPYIIAVGAVISLFAKST